MITQNRQVSSHSHIKGLGLDGEGFPITPSPSGFIGSSKARQAVGTLVDLIKSKKCNGVLVFISGPPGVGKSGLIHAVKQEIGAKTPLAEVLGGEFGDEEGPLKSTRVQRMRMALRRAVGVKMHESKKALEGEVTELTLHETAQEDKKLESLGKNISHITMTLKSAKGTRQFSFDPSIYASLCREQVQVGDIIHLETGSGLVKRLGRCNAYKYEYDLENETYLPLPKGEVEYTREVVQEVSLHEIDFAAANPEPGADILSQVKCIVQNTGFNRINMAVRSRVDAFITQKKAELIPGLLIIEDAHLMSFELYSFLKCTLTQEKNVPMVILVGQKELLSETNRFAKGIYEEFFSSCLSIELGPLSFDELMAAILCRAKHEQLSLDDESVRVLAQAATVHTLRYAFSLLPFIKSMSKDTTVTMQMTKQVMETLTPPPSRMDE